MEHGKKECPGSQPALMILFGSRGKNHWPLDAEVVTLGRARGCDIGLDAPEISSLHCLIWRSGAGLQLRDCGSRAGTLINGEPIVEALLHDGDVLQVGSFCFRLYLPAPAGKLKAPEARLRHLERSRHNLARLALSLRRRLRELSRGPLSSGPDPGALSHKASGLRLQFRAIQQRSQQLDQAERDLSRDKELLEWEKQAYLAWVEQTEQELAQREKEIEAMFRQRLEKPASSPHLETAP